MLQLFFFCSLQGMTMTGNPAVFAAKPQPAWGRSEHGMAWEGALGAPRKSEVKSQTACKPGSVPTYAQGFGGGWPFIWDARYRAPRAIDPDGGAETRMAQPEGPPTVPT